MLQLHQYLSKQDEHLLSSKIKKKLFQPHIKIKWKKEKSWSTIQHKIFIQYNVFYLVLCAYRNWWWPYRTTVAYVGSPYSVPSTNT